MRDKKAEIWDKRNQGGGEPYKKFVTDPIVLKLIDPIKNKVVIDQGCGNGYLSKKIARKNPKKIILLDYYEGNLNCARNNLNNIPGNFEFQQADFNKSIKLKSEIADYIVSSFVLNEIENLKIAVKETFRILKNKGSYIITVVHPCYDSKQYFIEKLSGSVSKKIQPTVSYFNKQKSKFIFGVDTHEKVEAPHFHRKLEDYFEILKSTGFDVDKIIEPKINKELLKKARRFESDQDCPIALIINATKP